ncbi:hypothetical protein [Deinococcus arenicola]|uniref:Uncharacterized protein n=1 Tax=Deinococcus arenicola TaxID=2994950 RepID=A0ABU4DLA7_9DEIO|nr:hypothetical protein [Deinococcus sp. ZS9-10]MDV6373215.1 hypothetical protein [Deinococcus sp. ZS9-10]
MSAETATAVNQIPMWFEWVKLIVPGIVTGLVILLGAYLAYVFARRGRKEDILYKERYRAYGEVAGYMYDIRKFIRIHTLTFDGSYQTEQEVIEAMDIGQKALNKLIESEPNKRNLVLLEDGIYSAYFNVELAIESIDSRVRNVSMGLRDGKYEKTEYRRKMHEIYKIMVSSQGIVNECDEIAHRTMDMFKDVDKPNKSVKSK